ncbi:protein O-mannosyl-transferase TMTC1-like [Leguminivora glycinivorella]|uniref:protein O-mannosyl-transferase TMTC1-like n=1 Tax=Leguminivora glycinivorella TaxID=1035111 RepID=UPI00200D3526|nr:protein O-mannosyl-transferase TMTC1-like [Leguminivora glycinivorella]
MCKFRNVTLRVRTLKMKRRAAAALPTLREESPRFNRDLALYGTVVITAVLSYINSLNGEFVHDDIPAVVMNPDVIGTNPLRKVFENDFWGTPMSDVNSHKSYRPLTTLSFSRLVFPLYLNKQNITCLNLAFPGCNYQDVGNSSRSSIMEY